MGSSRSAFMYKSNGGYKGISYGELRNLVEQLAYGLSALGIKRHDKVAILSENRPEWVISDMALAQLGAVSIPVYPTLTPKQIEYIFTDGEVVCAFVSNLFQLNKVQKIREAVPQMKHIIAYSEKGVAEDRTVTFLSTLYARGAREMEVNPQFLEHERDHTFPEDLLTIIYTSGTTGNPKGVMLTHKNLVSNIYCSAPCLPISDSDVILSYLPLSHSFERMAGYYTAFACGASIAYAETIESLKENILEVNPTIITTVPRVLESLYIRVNKQVESLSPLKQVMFRWAMNVGQRYSEAMSKNQPSAMLSFQNNISNKIAFRKIQERLGTRFRFFISGGAALSAEIGRFFQAAGVRIIEGYGMTECSPVISVNRMDDYKFGSVGKAIPGVEVKIADDGEILTRGPHVMKGYWKNKKETDEIIDHAGWLHTGDIGLFDPQGFLTITDRKKHIFVNTGGKNIAPQPIENLFAQSQYIDQMVLIGEKRLFCSALVVPDFEALKEYAAKHHIRYSNVEDLINNHEIRKLFEKDINSLQKDLSNYERVRKFTLLGNPLTIDNGEITPTLKVKRKIVEERYKDLIEKMYEGFE
ncbi:MAG: AMP-dependent synthetase/ligase [Bacteroidota bacterium]